MAHPTSSQPRVLWREPLPWLQSFWKFSRPHTIVGTTLSVWALAAIATPLPDLATVLLAWLACAGGNIYIVGLNQLADIDIDAINKPQLPLAAGEFTPAQGWRLVLLSGLAALSLAAFGGLWLLLTVGVSVAIGTAYSLPPVRLKRFPLLAALCIFSVRGVVVNLGLFQHYANGLTPAVWTLTAFVLVFTVAIAIFKDVPDLEGDKRYGIATYAIALGKPAIFQLARGTISACYVGVAIAAIVLPRLNAPLAVVGHLVLLGALWWRSRAVNLDDNVEIARFYQFIWRLFFLEYLFFPAVCWFA